ncbi:MAG: GNAT family protein [Reyranella sp.]|uniref:GNAT family N-acetyltransferase n=1 Tax=Reyranella sp. TaxID=1929291 RepID=UPI002731B17D|nr:GNAT family protein [Reyranella sp.]MDP1963208.1 GNAT family protein [Reyranella sp.]MDP2376182.1 GNAT family protein [Reyranella sp.]
MPLQKVALDGTFVRLEPLEERHRELLRPAAQHPEIFTVTTSALGALYDPYIHSALKRSDGVRELAFVVWHKQQDRPVGMTRYLNIEEAHKRLEIGSTWYEPSVWAGAVNPECKLLLMRHAFETLRFHRVEYKTDARNLRSRAAILKLGAVQEGILARHMIMADGHIRDSVIFSIVDTGWPAVKAGLEKRLAAPPR